MMCIHKHSYSYGWKSESLNHCPHPQRHPNNPTFTHTSYPSTTPDPSALQPLLPNTVSFLVSFSLQPSLQGLELVAPPELGWQLTKSLPFSGAAPFFIHFNHQTPVTRNIGPSVWNLPHKRKGRGHWCASHGRIAARIHLAPAETAVGDWWRRGLYLTGWQSIAQDQQVLGRKLEVISHLADSFSSGDVGVNAGGRPWILFVIYG